MNYGGHLPVRAAVLDVAKSWSVPPWEIAPDLEMTPLQWVYYWRMYQRILIDKATPGIAID